MISQYFGAGRTDKIWQCTMTSAIFSSAIALASTIGMWICAEPLLVLVNTPQQIVGMGCQLSAVLFPGLRSDLSLQRIQWRVCGAGRFEDAAGLSDYLVCDERGA